jgi:hypothetical protein
MRISTKPSRIDAPCEISTKARGTVSCRSLERSESDGEAADARSTAPQKKAYEASPVLTATAMRRPSRRIAGEHEAREEEWKHVVDAR